MSNKKQSNRKRTRRQIECDIRYEEAEGVHTYSQCSCGKHTTRAGRCAECLREELGGVD
jgi:hypothetical protein